MNPVLEQLSGHWDLFLRPRLDGLGDEEYLWEPVAGCWSLRERDGVWVPDFAFPEPTPPPVTTIAWRMAHLTVGIFAVRTHNHFGGPPASYESWTYAGTAAGGLAQLDAAYEDWRHGVATLSAEEWQRAVGPSEGPWSERTMEQLVLHITREMIHHGAEIALLRDLWRARQPS